MASSRGASRLLTAARALVAPDVGSALRRFPLPCAFSAILAVAVMLRQYEVAAVVALPDRVFAALVALALAAFAVDLLGEGRGWRAPARFAAQACAAAAIAALHVAPAPWRVDDLLLIPGLLLALSVAGFTGTRHSSDALWRFNERLWLSAGLALLGSGVFAVGIFVIDRSLDVLFGIDFERLVLNVVFPLSFGFLAPLTWLSAVPAPAGAGALQPDHFLDRAVRAIARFILVPLLLTYAVILFAYSLQILVTWQLPNGQIGWMVSAFGAAGAATTLLLHPERETGGRLVKGFLDWWYAATLVPVALLALAAYQRIAAYGLTPERYALVIGAVWLGALALAFAWRGRGARDIRLVPGLLALLLIAGSFGPWGAREASLTSQAGRFVDLAAASGWLEGRTLDREAIAAEAGEPGERSDRAQRAISLLHHFAAEDALPRLASRLDDPGALAAFAVRDPYLRGALEGQLGVEVGEMPPPPRPLAVAAPGTPVDLRGYDRLFGPIQLPVAPGWQGAGGSLDGGRITLALPGEAPLRIDLAGEAKAPDDEARRSATVPGFFVSQQEDGREVGVLLLDVAGTWDGERMRLERARLIVMLPRAAE